MTGPRPALPLFGGTWSPDPVIAAEQLALVRLDAAKRWTCGSCSCVKRCRQRARTAWLWRLAQQIEARRADAS